MAKYRICLIEGDGIGKEVVPQGLRALRAALGERVPSYDGPHFSFSGMVVEPHTTRNDVPLWIGGYTPRSLRRALELGTGWVPFGLPHDNLRTMLDGVDLPDGFEVNEPGGSWQLGTGAIVLTVWLVVGLFLAQRLFRWTRRDAG